MLLVCSGCLHLGAGNSHFCDLAMKVLRASIVLLRRMEWDTFSRCSPDFSKRWGEIRLAQLLFANSLVGCPLPLLSGWRSRVNSRHGLSRLASGWQCAPSLRAQRQKPPSATQKGTYRSHMWGRFLGLPVQAQPCAQTTSCTSSIVVARSSDFDTGRHYLRTSLSRVRGGADSGVTGCSIDVKSSLPRPRARCCPAPVADLLLVPKPQSQFASDAFGSRRQGG